MISNGKYDTMESSKSSFVMHLLLHGFNDFLKKKRYEKLMWKQLHFDYFFSILVWHKSRKGSQIVIYMDYATYSFIGEYTQKNKLVNIVFITKNRQWEYNDS